MRTCFWSVSNFVWLSAKFKWQPFLINAWGCGLETKGGLQGAELTSGASDSFNQNKPKENNGRLGVIRFFVIYLPPRFPPALFFLPVLHHPRSETSVVKALGLGQLPLNRPGPFRLVFPDAFLFHFSNDKSHGQSYVNHEI